MNSFINSCSAYTDPAIKFAKNTFNKASHSSAFTPAKNVIIQGASGAILAPLISMASLAASSAVFTITPLAGFIACGTLRLSLELAHFLNNSRVTLLPRERLTSKQRGQANILIVAISIAAYLATTSFFLFLTHAIFPSIAPITVTYFLIRSLPLSILQGASTVVAEKVIDLLE